MIKFTLTDLVMGFLCLPIYLPFLVIGMAVFAVVEAIHMMRNNDQAHLPAPAGTVVRNQNDQ